MNSSKPVLILGKGITGESFREYFSKKKNFLLEFDKVWVHGLLHLVGYNHVKEKDYSKMNKFEKRILNLI